jgi:type IV pilus assembly protein PilY1
VPSATGKLLNDFQNAFSAYVVMDVTNPEAPPVLLGELTNAQVNAAGKGTPTCAASTTAFTCATLSNIISTYTSSTPAMAMFRARNSVNPTPSKFFLFTGSGSTDNGGINGSVAFGAGGNVVSTANLMLRSYDMDALSLRTVTPTVYDYGSAYTDTTTGATNSFAGDLVVSDVDLDGLAESLYFGSSHGTGTAGYGGSIWSLDFQESPTGWSKRQIVPDLARPVTIRPSLALNVQGNVQVYFGTGRAYTKNDLADTSQQLIAGLVDKPPPAATNWSAPISSLKDVTNVNVTSGGVVSGAGANDTTEGLLAADILANFKGFVTYLDTKNASGVAIPAERVVSTQTLFAGLLLTTTYLPGTDSCTDQGSGRLYGMNYATGAASSNLGGLLGFSGSSTTINHYTSLGLGLPSSPSLHKGGAGASTTLRTCVQTGTGSVLCGLVPPLTNSSTGEISWREPIDK